MGKDEIRAYWTRQWQQFDPRVEPLMLTEEGDRNVRVKVHQLVKSLGGEVLSDSDVVHVFTMTDGLISAMHLAEHAAPAAGPSGAYAYRPT